MKRFSVKFRVTLWYASCMIILVLFILGFLFIMGQYVVTTGSKDKLSSIVENSYKEIEFDDGRLEIDDDLNSATNGVYLSVFDEAGTLLYGHIPNDFEMVPTFSAGTMRTLGSEENLWYVYDSMHDISGYGNIWLRGIMSFDKMGSAFDAMIKLSAVAMPFLVLITILMGYLITKRAFRPIEFITASAERIGKEKDLSKRIGLGEGTDEIYTLANTFDRMFDRLEDAFKNERRFTSDVSHELRTPTAVIISQCEYALENAVTLEEAKEALETVLGQSQRMSALISQILTLSRADSSHAKLHIELLNFSELIEVIALQQQDMAKEKDISVEMDIEPQLMMEGDETMLMRLLLNLTENGIRYGRIGGRLFVALHKENDALIVSVEDDGIGISEALLPKIWERFYQVDPARSSSTGGAGLGLSMVKWIAEAHGGSVSVKSELGVGTSFTVVFPLT